MNTRLSISIVLTLFVLLSVLCDKATDPSGQPTIEIWKGSVTDTLTPITHNFTFALISDNTFDLYDTVTYGGGLVESGTYIKTASSIVFTPLVDRVFNSTTFTWDTLSSPKNPFTANITVTNTATITEFIDISTTPRVIGNLTIVKQ